MFIQINKKRAFAVITAAIIASTTVGVLPASARLDEVLTEGEYSTPLAKEVEVVKTLAPKTQVNPVKRTKLEYQVKTGDTLWSIAERSGVSVDELTKANGLGEKNVLVTGRNLVIPGVPSTYHRVAAGETLSHIAGQYNVSLHELMAVNHITDADLVTVGQTLSIPGETESQTVTTSETDTGNTIQIGGWVWPAAGTITSYFGIREDRPHEGIDVGAMSGSTIVAPEKAKVVWAASRGTYGLAVILDHGNGLRSLYAHCSKLMVHEGQTVERNQTIAKVGSTGRSTGPHLHMEVLRQGIPLDPLLFLNTGLSN